MGHLRYTKAELEELVGLQLQNLDAMHDLIHIMKVQNELIRNSEKKLREDVLGLNEKLVEYRTLRKKRSG